MEEANEAMMEKIKIISRVERHDHPHYQPRVLTETKSTVAFGCIKIESYETPSSSKTKAGF